MTGPGRLEVGRIAKAHGLNGEVAVHPITNRPGRFDAGAVLYAGDESLVILSSRPHQGRWLVRFEGITDRSAAEARRGTVLSADAPGEPPEGEVWVHEMIGSSVVDLAGAPVGEVVAVEANPAHDLLVLDGGELIPMVFVVEVRAGEGDGPAVVVVDPPEGLLEINRREH